MQTLVSPLSACEMGLHYPSEDYPSPRSSSIPVKIIPMPLVADTTAPTLVVSAGTVERSIHLPQV
jgi:hypothetical protein